MYILKKIYIIFALILYPPFIVMFTLTILWLLLDKNIIENEVLGNLMSKLTNLPEPPAWALDVMGILVLVVILIIYTAELMLHIGTLKAAGRAARRQRQKNLEDITSSYTQPTITFDSTGVGHVSGGYSYGHRLFNGFRILQVLLYAILVILTPVVFPFDAILHLTIFSA